LLCGTCAQQLTTLPGRCYRCLRPSLSGLTCPDCSAISSLHRVQAATAYAGVAKELVWRLKSAGAKTAPRHMADLLVSRLSVTPRTVIIPVPTATSRVRSRGYDQAKLLAHELSRKTRLPYRDCLVRSGKTRQVGTSRRQRLNQLHDAFRVKNARNLTAMDVLLVDDVMTTGATLEIAATTLRSAGAGRVEAAVFCIAE